MNYSVELWDSYNKVENNLLFHLRGLKDFIYIITALNSSFKLFLENLKKLSNFDLNITTHESLSQGIENFKLNFINQFNSLEKYIYEINSQIIVPLNIVQERILKKLNSNYEETIKVETIKK